MSSDTVKSTILSRCISFRLAPYVRGTRPSSADWKPVRDDIIAASTDRLNSHKYQVEGRRRFHVPRVYEFFKAAMNELDCG